MLVLLSLPFRRVRRRRVPHSPSPSCDCGTDSAKEGNPLGEGMWHPEDFGGTGWWPSCVAVGVGGKGQGGKSRIWEQTSALCCRAKASHQASPARVYLRAFCVFLFSFHAPQEQFWSYFWETLTLRMGWRTWVFWSPGKDGSSQNHELYWCALFSKFVEHLPSAPYWLSAGESVRN